MTASTRSPTDWDYTGNAELRAYHAKQWAQEKRSTANFAIFLQDKLSKSQAVLDIACGTGAASAYLARRHPGTHYLGIDSSRACIETARALTAEAEVENLRFEVDDLFTMKPRSGVDGVVCLQTLSWLPAFEPALEAIVQRVSPRWIALSSLFYEGDISCKIEVREHAKDTCFYYNVYALPELRRFCASLGYGVTRAERFEIDIDLPKPESPDVMGTYTEQVSRDGGKAFERLQISGPLLMPWYNVLIEPIGS